MSGERRLRVLIFVLLLLDAALVYAALTAFGEQLGNAIAIAWSATFVLLALLILLRPVNWSLMLVKGISVGFILALGILLFMTLAMSRFEAGISASDLRRELLIIGVLFAVQIALIWASTRLENETAGDAVGTMLVGVGLAYVLFFGIAAIMYVVTPFIDFAITSPRFAADSVMQESVARVQKCAHAYASTDAARGYPADLRALGPDGTKCLDSKVVSGKIGRVTLVYTPGARDASGKVAGYSVLGRAAAGTNGEEKMAYADESGVLRTGFALADPKALRILGGSLRTMQQVRTCAEIVRARNPATGYPRATEDWHFASALDQREQIAVAALGCSNITWLQVYPRQPERITYTPAVTDGVVQDYVVEIRPGVYGFHGLRSFRATARGPVHMTLEDRPANDDDAIVPPCEYDLGDFLCAPLPGGIAPVARILRNSVAYGVPFNVKVEDARPPEQVDGPLQVSIDCIYHPYKQPKPKSEWSLTTDYTCVIPEGTDTGLGNDRAIVRAWLRNRAGTIGAVDDTISFAQH